MMLACNGAGSGFVVKAMVRKMLAMSYSILLYLKHFYILSTATPGSEYYDILHMRPPNDSPKLAMHIDKTCRTYGMKCSHVV
jgi:hypothetical protein